MIKGNKIFYFGRDVDGILGKNIKEEIEDENEQILNPNIKYFNFELFFTLYQMEYEFIFSRFCLVCMSFVLLKPTKYFEFYNLK